MLLRETGVVMDQVTLILMISPVLFVLVYWCWSSLMSAGLHESGRRDRTDSPEASRELEQVRGPASAYAEVESKMLAR
jgi:hypothetical protein